MTLSENSLNQQTIENIKREGIPVIIFGAGIAGEALFHACCDVGIRVECFCDNNTNKTNSSKCNIEVVHTLSLNKKYQDAIFVISAAEINDVVEQLHILGYSKWHPASLLLRDFDVSHYQFSAPNDFVEYAVDACLLCHDSYLTPDKLFVRSVDIIITERCSLKCGNCSNLMQYYQKPLDCNIEELMQSIDAFCNIIDEVNEFRVIGGEPFMNKEIHLVLKRLIDEPKVKRIIIYTNGTIVPKENQIEYLKNNKILLFITDYGIFSKKLNILTEKLSQNNIAFYVQKARGWTDCAKIMKHNRITALQKELFRNCCAKNTVTISNGKLFKCPFAANVDRLGAVPDFEEDCIDIFDKTLESTDIKKTIRTFLFERDFLDVCDYCNGRSFDDPEIEPAIQIDKPIKYKQYG